MEQMRQIDAKTAIDFLLPRHYSGRKPQVSIAFGLYIDDELSAVCTFGKPASPYLCIGVCGREEKEHVYELNRVCRLEKCTVQMSHFVGWCLKQLKKKDWIIVSYSDTAMNHHGYVYQATNFLYTGCTKKRTDMYVKGKHSRHATKDNCSTKIRKVRSAKHRYIYFCTNNKQLKKRWMKELRYPIKPYPKGDNSKYQLGHFLKEQVVYKNDCDNFDNKGNGMSQPCDDFVMSRIAEHEMSKHT